MKTRPALSVTIDPLIKRRIDEAAERLGVPRSRIVEECVRRCLEEVVRELERAAGADKLRQGR